MPADILLAYSYRYQHCPTSPTPRLQWRNRTSNKHTRNQSEDSTHPPSQGFSSKPSSRLTRTTLVSRENPPFDGATNGRLICPASFHASYWCIAPGVIASHLFWCRACRAGMLDSGTRFHGLSTLFAMDWVKPQGGLGWLGKVAGCLRRCRLGRSSSLDSAR